MKFDSCLLLLCCALTGLALAQQPAAPPEPLSPSSPAPHTSQPGNVEAESGHELPPPEEPLEVRVGRLLDGFNQRHDERTLAMSAYSQAGDTDPDLKQFADPRKVEIELKDEQDREQTSQALAKLYVEEARQVDAQKQTVQNFIAKRQKILDGLSKRASTVNRQDLELAAKNLARQPGTEAQVAEIRRQLDADDQNAKDVSTQQALAQQEVAGAQAELKNLDELEQSLQRESKSYTADAASAHQNQFHLADRLEFYLVNAQADDVLDHGRKAQAAVRHLEASPEVQDTLGSLNPGEKRADTKSKPLNECTEAASDQKGCADPAPPPASKE